MSTVALISARWLVMRGRSARECFYKEGKSRRYRSEIQVDLEKGVSREERPSKIRSDLPPVSGRVFFSFADFYSIAFFETIEETL